jgi:hypothetical protein
VLAIGGATVSVAAVAVRASVAAPGVTITRSIVLDRSIAGVSLGETRASIERRIGAGFVLGDARTDPSTAKPRHVERIEYDAAGLYVTYVSTGSSARELAAGRAVVLETTWTSFRTPQGVHVGSPAAALRAIPGIRCFGSVCQHGYARGGGGTTFMIDQTRRRIVRVVVSFGAQ